MVVISQGMIDTVTLKVTTYSTKGTDRYSRTFLFHSKDYPDVENELREYLMDEYGETLSSYSVL